MKSKNKVNRKQKNKRQISVFTILFLIVLTLIVIFICTVVNWIVQTIRYKSYTDEMYFYGYNDLYSNKKATAFQKVTNLDMLKVIIGSVNNTTNVTEITLTSPTEKITSDDLWYQAAKDMNLTINMDQKKLDNRAKVIDAVIAIMRTLEWSLDVNIHEAELKMSEAALKNFTTTERKYIAKAVNEGIIANDDSGIRNKKLIKGELNKLIIEVANKYATVHYDTVSLDENGFVVKNDVHIVTKEQDKPNNAEEYPYIISNIDKSIYEIEFRKENERSFKNPKEVYTKMGHLYGQIDETIERYFNAILNINYNSIDEANFLNAINATTTYKLNLDDIVDYINYVKENNIILKGKAQPLLPIMYDTGNRYVVRTKVEFEIVNSKTKINLLFGDNQNVSYNEDKITMYIDLPMGMTLNSNTLLVDINCNARYTIIENSNITFVNEEGNE